MALRSPFCLLGCAVLIGWQFDIQALKQVLPGFASMNPATAACFIAAGCSLWLAGSDAPGYRRLSLALAVIVISTAAWKLAAEMIGFNFGPDQIAFPEAVNAAVPPSRVAASTSVGFLLSGDLSRFSSIRRKKLSSGRAVFCICFGPHSPLRSRCLPVRQRALDSKLFSLMAAHTSWGLLLLALGLLFKNTDVGWMSLVVSKASAGRLLQAHAAGGNHGADGAGAGLCIG